MQELDCEVGWVPKNWCFWTVVLEKTLESPLDFKEIQPVHSEGDQPWDFFGRNDSKAEAPVLWPPHAKSWLIGKRLWCWEGLRAGGEGDDRGWDGWMASLTQWTWVWVSSGSWWWTGRPGVLRFMGSQRVGHDWPTGLNWTDLNGDESGRWMSQIMKRKVQYRCCQICNSEYANTFGSWKTFLDNLMISLRSTPFYQIGQRFIIGRITSWPICGSNYQPTSLYSKGGRSTTTVVRNETTNRTSDQFIWEIRGWSV